MQKKKSSPSEWVRILTGVYKNDIACVESFDDKNVTLKIIPRIEYDKKNKTSKRRPPAQQFNPELIRYI